MPLLLSNLIIMIVTFSTKALAHYEGELRLRVFAEMSILVTTNCFLAFNIVSVEDNFVLGYVTISVVGFYVFISMLIMLKNLFV